MLITIISFLFVFTIITLAHELGHLFFAKRVGIAVPEFGIGFGPTIFSFTKNRTLYKINLLPILGYVKIAGLDADDEQEAEIPAEEKYTNKKVSQKFVPILAGAVMNLILGFVIFSFIFMISGIPTGISNEISAISPGSEAAKVGLQAGDKLIALNGQRYAEPEKLIKQIHQSAGKQLKLTIERSGKRLTIAAVPQLNKKLKIGLIGFSLSATHKRVGPVTAVWYGLKETWTLIITILGLVGSLFIGRLSIFDLAGPVGIAQITGQYAQHGLISLMSFIAFFSINVGVLNLLPIPALDGGRLLFVLVEAVRGKPLPLDQENKFHYIGLYALLGLLAILTINDILRFFR